MTQKSRLFTAIIVLAATALACSSLGGFNLGGDTPQSYDSSSSAVTSAPITRGDDEPVLVTGTIPFTSPFFLESNAEPFVLLEDEAGFVNRDREFVFPLDGQAIGPVEQISDSELQFSLPLPSVPQGTLVDVDNNGQTDQGVMIFVVAYWSNTWDGPFLEERDGTGWSNAYASTTTDPNREDEINGGTMVIWAPDGQQSFPTGFGEDNKLFTEDDPVAPVPAGYSFVDLEQSPFNVYKQSSLELVLNEGESAVKDYSDMSYTDAFEALFERVSKEYPFTEYKHLDWDGIYSQIAPLVASANSDSEFYNALRQFTYLIPDGHVGVSFDYSGFGPEFGGAFGLVLDQLSDGSVVVKQVLPQVQDQMTGQYVASPAAEAGIQPGAEIISMDGQPVAQVLESVVPYFSPFSDEDAKREQQLVYLARVPQDAQLELSYRNVGQSEETITLNSVVEFDSLYAADPLYALDPLATPIEVRTLDSGIAYFRINSLLDDTNLTARLWDRAINAAIDNDVPGIIIDLRANGGGSGGLAVNFASYFYDDEFPLYFRESYNPLLGDFERSEFPARIQPAPAYYSGPVAVLVSPSCISACEGMAYALASTGRATVLGYAGTAGAFGDVGFGQYTLPGGYSMQFPTGRPIDENGNVVVESVGIQPDIIVEKTLDAVTGADDPVLDAAVQAVQN